MEEWSSSLHCVEFLVAAGITLLMHSRVTKSTDIDALAGIYFFRGQGAYTTKLMTLNQEVEN